LPTLRICLSVSMILEQHLPDVFAFFVRQRVLVLNDKVLDGLAFFPVEYMPGQSLGAGVFSGLHVLNEPQSKAVCWACVSVFWSSLVSSASFIAMYLQKYTHN